MDECLGHEPEDMIGCSYCEIESLKEQLDNYKQVLTESLMISTTPELKRFKRKATKLLGGE